MRYHEQVPTTPAAQLLPRAGELLWVFDAAGAPDADREGLVLHMAYRLAAHHLRQWDAEDAARDPQAADDVVAATKRDIDAMNATRVEMVEQIDGWTAARVGGPPETPLHTETFGSVVDRLAVTWVRVRRLIEAGPGDPAARTRARHATRQLAELGDAYDDLVREMTAGRRRVPCWLALKSYGRRE